MFLECLTFCPSVSLPPVNPARCISGAVFPSKLHLQIWNSTSVRISPSPASSWEENLSTLLVAQLLSATSQLLSLTALFSASWLACEQSLSCKVWSSSFCFLWKQELFGEAAWMNGDSITSIILTRKQSDGGDMQETPAHHRWRL